MALVNYIPLECHSHYSMLRGTLSHKFLPELLLKAGHRRFALADTDGIYGLILLNQMAVERQMEMIAGVTLFDKNQRKAVLLVKNATGYSNLTQLTTQKHADSAAFDLRTALSQRLEGLVLITPDQPLLETFRAADTYASLELNAYSLYKWSQKQGIPAVANIPIYYGGSKGHHLHRIMRAIDLNTKLSRLPAEAVLPPEYVIHSVEQILKRLPYAPETIERTVEIADKCEWRPALHDFIFPESSASEDYQELHQKVVKGIKKRYGGLTTALQARMDHELRIIREKHFSKYFLIVQDIVKECPITCGRGSAAASIVAYALEITHVDPMQHNLFFERFLTPGRTDPPDIDVDFPWDQRDDVLNYVFEKYGETHSAMICNHVTFKARAAIHEVAKVYGLTESEITLVTKRLGGLWYLSNPYDELARNPLLKDLDLHDPWPEIIKTGFHLSGFPRHMSVHPGGVVLTPGPTANYVPVQTAPKGVKIIQWEKDQAEDFGLVKIDLLGNRSLAVIRDALKAIEAHYGVEIPYWRLNPLEDVRTRELIRTGQTMGCFYVESPATRQLLQKMQSGEYEHLVIASSIIRPAANKWIREFVRRLHGGTYDPLHPLLQEALNETYGIMVYQEDVTRVAMALANFTADDGDQLRKVISKKHKQAKLRDFKIQFYQGARKNNVADTVTDVIWEMIMSFAGYSFCKPHSASYALVSFKSAYIRAHYPAEFMASVISNQGGYYAAFGYISEARRMGLRVLLPDINASEIRYTGHNDTLRVGLMQLKGIQQLALEGIVHERETTRGSFTNFEDFLKRVELDLADIRILIKAGCFDSIAEGKTRPQLMWELHQQSHARDVQQKKELTLYDDNNFYLPATPEYNNRTILKHEIEVLGFLISRHPLTLYRALLRHLPVIKASELRKHVGEEVLLIGWMITGKVVHTKTDEPMEFISFEDTTAMYETTFFPEVYRRFCHMLSKVRPYLIQGLVEEDYSAITVTISAIEFLDKIDPRTFKGKIMQVGAY